MGVLLASLSWPIEIVVPVPIGRARRKERGYNQAALLAYPLALCSEIPYQSHALSRKRETRTQVGLNPLERKLNVADAFVAAREFVEGKSVLVVDDVTTTGATLNACAQALISAGARLVYGLTLARAGLDQDPV
jgi:ComF family protein